MSDIEQAYTMLGKAENDAKALAAMGDPEAFPDDIFGFHAQQAVEKALKAWLSAAGVVYPKVHDLEFLFDLLSDAGQDEATSFRDLISLTEYAVQFRYMTALDLSEELDRAAVNRRVRELLDLVQERVSEHGS